MMRQISFLLKTWEYFACWKLWFSNFIMINSLLFEDRWEEFVHERARGCTARATGRFCCSFSERFTNRTTAWISNRSNLQVCWQSSLISKHFIRLISLSYYETVTFLNYCRIHVLGAMILEMPLSCALIRQQKTYLQCLQEGEQKTTFKIFIWIWQYWHLLFWVSSFSVCTCIFFCT